MRNFTSQVSFSKGVKRSVILMFSLIFGVLFSTNVTATVVVTAAPGGTGISADKAKHGLTPAFTSLGVIKITEGATMDFAINQNYVTFFLVAPSNFKFNISTGTVSQVGTGFQNSVSLSYTDSAHAMITFSTNSSTTSIDAIWIAGLQIQPVAPGGSTSGSITYSAGTAVMNMPVGTVNCGNLSMVAGALHSFAVSATASEVDGIPFNVAITAKDNYGNTLSTYSGVLNLTTTAGIITPDTSQSTGWVSGTKTESVNVTKAGVGETITATAPATGTTGTCTINVSANTFTKLQLLVPGETAAPGTSTGLTGLPSNETAGVPFTITVNAVDANWNIVDTVTDIIHISSTDVDAVIPGNCHLVSGTKTFTNGFTFNTTGIQTISAGDVTHSNRGFSSTPSILVISPTPVITSLSYNCALAGDDGLDIIVNGSNYTSGSIVSIGTYGLATTYYSPTLLEAIIPGTYLETTGTPSITVTNYNHVSNAVTFTITNPPSVPTIITTPSDINEVVTVCENSTNVTFAASATGDGITYQWYNSSGAIIGATYSSYTINSAPLTAYDIYYVVVTGDCAASVNDQTTSDTYLLVVNPLPQLIVSETPTSCHTGQGGDGTINNGTITITPDDLGPNYAYSINGGSTFPQTDPNYYTYDSNPYISANIFEDLTTGIYQVVIQDDNGCYSAPVPDTVGQPDSIQFGIVCGNFVTGQELVSSAPDTWPSSIYPLWESESCYGGNDVHIYIVQPYQLDTTQNTNLHHPYFNSTDSLPYGPLGGTPDGSGYYWISLDSGNGNFNTPLADSAGVSNAGLYSWGYGEYDYAPLAGAEWYYVRALDNNGCFSATIPVQIIQPTALTVTSDSTNVSCYGAADGTITASASGGTGPYGYNISTNPDPYDFSDTTGVFTGLDTGTYAINVMDANGCDISTISITITEPAVLAPSVGGTSGTNLNCYGDNSGTVTTVGSGGTAPYTYAWTGPSSYTSAIQSPTGLAMGTYYVTITDYNNCTTNTSVTITQPIPLLAGTPTSTSGGNGYQITCYGGSDGNATANPTGGTTSYTYSWTGPNSFTSANQTITGLVAGTYNVTITDANLCSTSTSIILSQPSIPVTAGSVTPSVAAYGGVNISCNGGSDGTVSVPPTGGSGGYTYSWTGPNSYTSAAQEPTGLFAGLYSVTVTDDNGCTSTLSSASFTLTQPNSPVSGALFSDSYLGGFNISCYGLNNGDNTVTPTGGVGNGVNSNYTYSWTGPNTFTSSLQSNSSGPIGLYPGAYNITITDQNSCTGTNTINLTQPQLLAISPYIIQQISCNYNNDGSFEPLPTGGYAAVDYSFTWNPNTSGTFCGVLCNAYAQNDTVTISDTASPNQFFYLQNISLSGLTYTTHDVSTDTAYINFTNSYPTNDTLIVSDTAYQYYSLQGILLDTLTYTTHNFPTDTAFVTFTNIYSETFTDTVVIFRAGSSFSYTDTVVVHYAGSYDGAPDQISNLAPGTYTVTVTDDNGCTATNTVDFTSPSPVVVPAYDTIDVLTSFRVFNVSCQGANDGIIIFDGVYGGDGFYDYSILDTGSNPVFDSLSVSEFGELPGTYAGGLPAGSYILQAVDYNGCLSNIVAPVIINDAATMTADTAHTDETCYQDDNGSIIITNIAGGNTSNNYFNNYQYQTSIDGGNTWQNAVSYAYTYENLAPGTYDVQIRDSISRQVVLGEPEFKYCTYDFGIITINGPTAQLMASVTPDLNPLNCWYSTTNISVTGSGGTPYITNISNSGTPYDVSGYSGVYGTDIVTGVGTGDYSYTITDSLGCTATGYDTITAPDTIKYYAVAFDNSTWNNQTPADVIPVPSNVLNTTIFTQCYASYTAQILILDTAQYTQYLNGTFDPNYPGANGPVGGNNAIGYAVSTNGGVDFSYFGQYTLPMQGDPSDSTDAGANADAYYGINYIVVEDENLCTTAPQYITILNPAPVTGTLTVADFTYITCYGDSTGLQANPSGGFSPYSYELYNPYNTNFLESESDPNNAFYNTVNYNGYPASNSPYIVIISDANGCSSSASYTLTQPSQLAGTVSYTNITCFGLNNGTITISNPTGGTGTILFSIDGADYFSNVYPINYTDANSLYPETYDSLGKYTGLYPDVYPVYLHDAANCTVEIDYLDEGVTITEPPQLVAGSTSSDLHNGYNISCYGGNDGDVSISPTGGTTPYTYSWTGPNSYTSALQSPTGLYAGTYNVTVIDNNGCTDVSSAVLLSPDSLSITPLIVTPVTCNGGSDGSITTVTSGGAGTNLYAWSGPGTYTASTPNISSLIQGGYAVTVIDVNNCIASTSANITDGDTTRPTINCPGTANIYSDYNACSSSASIGTATASDNCTVSSVTASPTGPYNLGTTTVIWTATDNSGNTSTCSQIVNVTDTTSPSVSTNGGNITVDNDNNLCSASNIIVPQPTYSDNCSTNSSSTISNTVTYEAWINPNGEQVSAAGIIFRRDGGPTAGIDFGFSDPTKIGYHWDDIVSTYEWTGGPAYTPGVWSHVALVITPDSATVYLNGVAYVNNVANPAIDLGGLTKLGVDNCCGNRHFNGTMDEVRIWNYALTTDEINASMNSELVGNEPGLVTYFKFDQNTAGGTNTNDTVLTATKGRNGTLYNFGLSGSTSNWVAGEFGNGLNFDGVDDYVSIDTLNLNSNLLTVSSSHPSTTYPVGTTTVTWTATDGSGNTSTVSQTVTVNDTQAPNAVCTPYTVYLNASGTASITYSNVDGGSTDNCSIMSESVSPSTFTCSNVGANTVTLTVTDSSNNTATCSTIVTVVDNIAPTAICAPYTVYLNASGTASITGTNVDGGSSDNCTITNWSVSPSTFVCGSVGANTVILTVTDESNNTASCSTTVTVVDNTPPNAICAPYTVYLNASGNASITFSNVDGGSTDNCSISSESVSPSSFTCTNVGPNTVTLTVTDASNNTATCSTTVTVVDNTAPSAVCAPYTVYLNASGTASITGTNVDGGSTDNCTIKSLSVNPSSFTCGNIGANTVTLTVTDASNNTASCSTTVTVLDNTAPNAVCAPYTVYLNASGSASITGTNVDGGSTDNCTISSRSVSPSTFNCSNVGANTVTLTVTDESNNTSSCSTTVTVVDNTAPNAVCAPYTVYLNASGTASITYSNVDGGSTDNCTIKSESVSPSIFTCTNVGPNTVTLTVTDASNNTATCSTTVTVIDNTAPNAVCTPYTVYLNALGTASITGTNVDGGSTDNCTIKSRSVSPSTFTCGNIGANTVTLTVTDASNNTASCSTTVTVVDSTAPNVVCTPYTVHLNASGTASIIEANVDGGSTDNCTISSRSVSPSTFNCSNVGANTVTITVTDESNNTSSCSTTVTVVDNTAPNAVCAPYIVYLNASGTASITYSNVDGGSTDNCTIKSESVSPSLFTCSNVGANTVTLTVTDASNNTASCSTTVTVIDNIAPNAVCTPYTVYLNALGTASITGTNVDGGSTDNCTIASRSVTPSSFTCSNRGANTVTLTVTDEANNTASCSTTVTVLDSIAPTISCGSNYTANNDASQCYATISTTNPITSDNCSVTKLTFAMTGATVYNSSTSGINYVTSHQFNTGITTVTYTASDAASNTASCSYTITAKDTTAPTFSGIPNSFTATRSCQGSVALTYPTATDNCSVTKVTWAVTGVTTDSSPSTGINNLTTESFHVGVSTVTYTASDSSNNTATCSFMVTVKQLTDSLTSPKYSGYNLHCHGGSDGSITSIVSNGTGYTYSWTGPGTFTSTTANISGLIVGTYNVTVSATGVCTATATYTETQPAASLAANVTDSNLTCYQNASGKVFSSPTGGATTYSYVWNTAPSATNSSITGLTIGTYTVTVSDANGCTATGTATLTQPNLLTVSLTGTNVTTCRYTKNGTINASATGGTTTYSYAWSGVTAIGNTSTSIGLDSGNYVVTVTDAKSCTASASHVISSPAALTFQIQITNNSPCYNSGNGKITVLAAEGSSPVTPFHYSDNNGTSFQTTPNFFATLNAGTYSVVVTDNNGCTSTNSSPNSPGLCVVGPSQPAINSITNSLIHSGKYTDTVHAGGGTPPYTYKINTLSGFRTHNYFDSITCNTNYYFVVADAKSCQSATSPAYNIACREENSADNTNSSTMLKVYPNPANDHITVLFSADVEESYNLRIVDILGQVMQSYSGETAVGDNQLEINLSQVAKGVYIVDLDHGTTSGKLRIIVQ